MLNFGLRWGHQEEGFCKVWDGGLEPEGDRRLVKGCCLELVGMLVTLRHHLGHELGEGGSEKMKAGPTE